MACASKSLGMLSPTLPDAKKGDNKAGHSVLSDWVPLVRGVWFSAHVGQHGVLLLVLVPELPLRMGSALLAAKEHFQLPPGTPSVSSC